jgi:hypothetical protein
MNALKPALAGIKPKSLVCFAIDFVNPVVKVYLLNLACVLHLPKANLYGS